MNDLSHLRAQVRAKIKSKVEFIKFRTGKKVCSGYNYSLNAEMIHFIKHIIQNYPTQQIIRLCLIQKGTKSSSLLLVSTKFVMQP